MGNFSVSVGSLLIGSLTTFLISNVESQMQYVFDTQSRQNRELRNRIAILHQRLEDIEDEDENSDSESSNF